MTRRRRLWLVGAVVLVVLVAAVAVWQARRPAPAVATVVEPLARGPFVREVTGTGVVEAARERALAFEGGGSVAEVRVVEGVTVEAGEVLARLDVAALERDAEAVRASLASARADRARLEPQQRVDRLELESSVRQAEDALVRAERARDDAAREAQLAQQLFDVGATASVALRAAEEALDAAERALQQARLTASSARSRLTNLDQLAAAQIAASDAQLAQLEINLRNLEARLQDAVLVAPFAGVVTVVSVRSGDRVGTQPVISVVDTDELQVRGRFDENRAVELFVGQSAAIVPDADASVRLAASLDRISPVAQRDGAGAQVSAVLTFDEPPGATVRPGYTVTVRVRVREIADALLVPLEAISGSGEASYVVRVLADDGVGTAEHVPVEVLERNPTVAAVRVGPVAEGTAGAGLRAGDLVAVVDVDAIADGDRVSFAAPDRGGAGLGD
ncbi:MAG: HlyD family efflux transporter periplasmic adaptor subunit [Trueperaceae bacterium]|nr:HlyD family efflux transporter periplasmic adaptor subunit [Trueperaceae bacterium]